MARIVFDRGTLRLEAPAPLARALPDFVWDPRTKCLRAPAYRYAEVLARAEARGIELEDGLAASLGRVLSLRRPTLRPYQEDALQAWRAHGSRGVAVLPTGAGKTRVAIAAAAELRTGVLVLCPTRALLEQWETELGRWYDGPIGVVGDGCRTVEAITIMTFESAYRHADTLGGRFGLLVVDEAHHFATGGRAEALEMCPAPHRLGLTATAPPGGTAEADRLRDLLGPTVCEVSVASLVGSHLAPAAFVRLSVRLTAEERERYEADYRPFAKLYGHLARATPGADPASLSRLLRRSAEGRAALTGLERAVSLASFPDAKRRLLGSLLERHREDRTLVFTALAREAYAVARELLVPVITADIARAERREVLDGFRQGTYRAIVSARVLNEGIDVPDARVAIVLGGRLGVREHVQRIGRVLRPAPGKRAVVYDVATTGTVEDRSASRRQLALVG